MVQCLRTVQQNNKCNHGVKKTLEFSFVGNLPKYDKKVPEIINIHF